MSKGQSRRLNKFIHWRQQRHANKCEVKNYDLHSVLSQFLNTPKTHHMKERGK